MVLFALLSAAALWLVLQLNPLTFRLSLVGAALTVSYPVRQTLLPAAAAVSGNFIRRLGRAHGLCRADWAACRASPG